MTNQFRWTRIGFAANGYRHLVTNVFLNGHYLDSLFCFGSGQFAGANARLSYTFVAGVVAGVNL